MDASAETQNSLEAREEISGKFHHGGTTATPPPTGLDLSWAGASSWALPPSPREAAASHICASHIH